MNPNSSKGIFTGSSKKSLPLKKIGLFGGGGLLLVGLIIGGIFAWKGITGSDAVGDGKLTTAQTLLETDSFFAPNPETKLYALFDGKAEKKLTDYKFKYAYNFVNKTSLVVDDQKRVGIIKDDGTMLVEFGDYDKITRAGTLYEVERKSDKTHDLINHNKKKIKVPAADGQEWQSRNFSEEVTGAMYRVWNHYATDLYPNIIVGDDDDATTYILSFEGKEIKKQPGDINYAEDFNSAGFYTTLSRKNETLVIYNKTSKIVAELGEIKATYGDGDVALIVSGTMTSKPEKYTILKNGVVTAEIKGDECSTLRLERMPSDNSLVAYCKKDGKAGSRLLDLDGTTIAEGSLYYTKDQYVSIKDGTVSFHKGGKVVKAVALCQKSNNLPTTIGDTVNNNHYTAIDAYVIPKPCVKSAEMDIYDSEGNLVTESKNYDITKTDFTKNRLGVAPTTKLSSRDSDNSNSFIVDSALNKVGGPINLGGFVKIKDKMYYVSSASKNNPKSVIYSGDLKTIIYETPNPIKTLTDSREVRTGNFSHSPYTPLQSVILFLDENKTTYNVFDAEAKQVVKSGIPDVPSPDIDVFKAFIRVENKDDSNSYFYRSGRPVNVQ